MHFEYIESVKIEKSDWIGSDNEVVARWTGLEPATPCVTGRYSNQLNYHRACIEKMVGTTGLEPVTSTL